MKRLVLIVSVLILLFTGCAVKQPKEHINSYGEACTYDTPFNKHKLEEVIGKALWGVFTTLGGEQKCLTRDEWAHATNVGNAMAGAVQPLIMKNQQPYINNQQPYTTFTSRPQETAYSTSPKNSNGCSSNIDCGFGSTCVKPQFSSSGTCMKQVNSKGIQQFNTNGSNMGIKVKPDCRFDPECPFGFSCINGSCVK